MVAGGTAAVGIGYWVLRTGELTARAGFMSPTVAAWAPFALMVAVCAGISVARR
jgi:lipopolysaccharide export LptBFGC system permease protein LptF